MKITATDTAIARDYWRKFRGAGALVKALADARSPAVIQLLEAKCRNARRASADPDGLSRDLIEQVGAARRLVTPY